MKRTRFTFTLLFTLSALSAAQDRAPVRVQTGDAMLKGNALVPYKNQWRVSVTTPQGKRRITRHPRQAPLAASTAERSRSTPDQFDPPLHESPG
jgi:hypothetical protein